MAYTINHYNGKLITKVADGTIDTSIDVTLIGKNYAGYGQVQNENFVYLLENFANTTQPPSPLQGQIWFDSGNKKLKFYDGAKFRVAGGAEVSPTSPGGLTVGDLWFNTNSNQLYVYTGRSTSNAFTLIGPQGVGGSNTRMESLLVTDGDGNQHKVIKAIVTDAAGTDTDVFVVSTDGTFTLDDQVSNLNGFAKIHPGVTLRDTTDELNQPGVTTTSYRFWGTASNADRLGGYDVSSFVQSGNAKFSTLVGFPDVGFTVGDPIPRLKIYNKGSSTPTIQNQVGDTISFETTVASQNQTPMQLVGPHILPGQSGVTNLGAADMQFAYVYANKVYATSSRADQLKVNELYRSASVDTAMDTIAVRDSNGNLSANYFNGTATSAYYADLAEKYLPDAEYTVGTVMKVGGDKEVTAAGFGDLAIGVISEKPAFMMNKDLVGGVYVALKGRVPVKVLGPVSKGDQMMPTGNGYARKIVDADTPRVFAVALEDNDGADVKLVECLIL